MLPHPPIHNLTQDSLGIPLSQIPEEKQSQVIKDLKEAFYAFIFEYIEIEYSRADSVKLKTAHKNNLNIFQKFPELEKKYQTATQKYFEMLKDPDGFVEGSSMEN